MSYAPYPPQNDKVVITFREPFPKVEYSPNLKMYIRAIMGDEPEQLIRFDNKQQIRVVKELIKVDGKLLNAKVLCQGGRFYVLEHSPQSDFFNMVSSKNKGR